MPDLIPVEGNPFEQKPQPSLTPVEGNPFAAPAAPSGGGGVPPVAPAGPAAAPRAGGGDPPKSRWDPNNFTLYRMGKSLVEGAVDAFKLPGDVYSGKQQVNDPMTGHTSQQLLDRSVPAAGLMINAPPGMKAGEGFMGAAKGERKLLPRMNPAAAGAGEAPGSAIGGIAGDVAKAAEKPVESRVEAAKPVELPRMGKPEAPIPETHPEAREPPGPKQFVRGVEDDLYRVAQSGNADRAEVMERLKAMPEAYKTPEVQEKFYRYGEGDPSVQLTPEEKQAFDTYIEPMRQEMGRIQKKVEGLGYEVDNSQYMRRIVKGKSPEFDQLEGAAAARPQGGYRSLPQKASPQFDRTYYVAEAEDGTRKLLSIKNGEASVIEKGKSTHLPLPDDAAPGGSFKAAGKTWTIKQARTAEIEANTATRYYKNAFANTAEGYVKMKRLETAVDTLERLKGDPQFKAMAAPPMAKDVPADWRPVRLKQLEGWKLDPRLADAIDDFTGKQAGRLDDVLNAVNRVAVGSIFWNPIPHLRNVAEHWFVGRGFSNFTVPGTKRLYQTAGKAINEVVNQGPVYRELLREGMAGIYAGTANADFYEKMLKQLGTAIEKDPKKWSPVAKAFGFDKLSDFTKAYYQGVNKVLWAGNDMFLTQRVLELKAQGMTTREAIKEAEKHIPNYRIPSEIGGNRAVSEALQHPALIFSRYHYGMLKSYGLMARDMVKGTAAEKKEALGNLAALAVLAAVVYPAMNWAAQKATGNKNAKVAPRGPMSVPTGLVDWYNGDASFPMVISRMLTFSPAATAPFEMAFNREMFSGKPIVQSDPRTRPGTAAAEAGDYALRKTISPYGTVSQAVKNRQGGESTLKSVGRGIVESASEIKNPSPNKQKIKKAMERKQRKMQRFRDRDPNLLERAGQSFRTLFRSGE